MYTMRLERTLIALLLLTTGALVTNTCATPTTGWTPSDTLELGRYLRTYENKLLALNSYVIRSTIASYQKASDSSPAEVESSVLWKVGDRMRSEAFGVISLQDKTMHVVIDPEEGLIQVSEPEGQLNSAGAEARAIMFLATQQVRKATDPQGVRFQLTFPKQAKYSTVELLFDKEGWLRGITTHWGQPIALDPGNPLTAMVTPKLQLEMTVPTPVKQVPDMDIANVIDRKTLRPAAKSSYVDYEVYDTRIP